MECNTGHTIFLGLLIFGHFLFLALCLWLSYLDIKNERD